MSDEATETVTALATQEGWHSEGPAARIHYRGGRETYSVEYYATTAAVLYWRVDDEVAVPVDRDGVPSPLRERIRADLDEAGVDPAVERRPV